MCRSVLFYLATYFISYLDWRQAEKMGTFYAEEEYYVSEDTFRVKREMCFYVLSAFHYIGLKPACTLSVFTAFLCLVRDLQSQSELEECLHGAFKSGFPHLPTNFVAIFLLCSGLRVGNEKCGF